MSAADDVDALKIAQNLTVLTRLEGDASQTFIRFANCECKDSISISKKGEDSSVLLLYWRGKKSDAIAEENEMIYCNLVWQTSKSRQKADNVTQ